MNGVNFISYDLESRPVRGAPAGNITCPPESVRLQQIAGGALLQIGFKIAFPAGISVSINNLAGEVFFDGPKTPILLGIGVDPQAYVINTDYKFPRSEPARQISGSLRLALSPAALELVERVREGGAPKFRLAIGGSALVFDSQSSSWDTCLLQIDGGIGATIQVTVSRDHWIQQLRSVSPMGSVLVEIPIATTRDSPWDKVWGQLDKASAHFNAGGETGWEGCVVSVRKALELQAGIEERSLDAQKLDKGQGQRERLNGVARALYHYCSLSVHTDKHETAWTRADATLALSTLCALLSASAV